MATPSAYASSGTPQHFADRLVDAIDRAGTPACVGLDPVADKLPAAIRSRPIPVAEQLYEFCRGVLDATDGLIPAVKVQAACFERHGAAGVEAMHRFIGDARRAGRIVVLDAKRGDIGVTADHYAASAFAGDHASDALTVNAYLGLDTLEPYLAHPGRGIFVLVRTSNPGSDVIQSQVLQDGRTVAQMMADHVHRFGEVGDGIGSRDLSRVGAVVAATKPADAQELRRRMPNTPFLVPGYGAQGGTLEDIRALWRPGAKTMGEGGVLVTASRSVIYAVAAGTSQWQDDVRSAAARFAGELGGLSA